MSSKKFWRIFSYLVGEVIDKGTFSSIRLAYHTKTLKPYALKIISKEKVRRLNQKRQDEPAQLNKRSKNEKKESEDSNLNMAESIFFAETVISPLLTHKNLVRTVECVETSNSFFQFMDLCSDGNLLDVICDHEQKVSFSQRIIYLGQIIDAVEYLHEHFICHRDIKLENILIHRGNAKLCDFGFCALCTGTKTHQTVSGKCGTVQYVAPEVIKQNSYDGRAADMWSLGILMYKLFLNDPNEIEDTISYQNFDYQKIPNDISELIKRLVVVDPSQRLTIFQLKQKFISLFDTPINSVSEIMSNANMIATQKINLSRIHRSSSMNQICLHLTDFNNIVENDNFKNQKDDEKLISRLCEVLEKPRSTIITDLNDDGNKSDIINQTKILAKLIMSYQDSVRMNLINLRHIARRISNSTPFFTNEISNNKTYVAEFDNKSVCQISKSFKKIFLKYNFCIAPKPNSSSTVLILNTAKEDIKFEIDCLNGDDDNSCRMTLFAPLQFEDRVKTLFDEIRSSC